MERLVTVSTVSGEDVIAETFSIPSLHFQGIIGIFEERCSDAATNILYVIIWRRLKVGLKVENEDDCVDFRHQVGNLGAGLVSYI